MTEHQYKKWIVRSYASLNLNSNKYLNLGRDTTLVIIEVEEVQKNETCALGKWSNDVFQENYSYNIPLCAMYTMDGFDNKFAHCMAS